MLAPETAVSLGISDNCRRQKDKSRRLEPCGDRCRLCVFGGSACLCTYEQGGPGGVSFLSRGQSLTSETAIVDVGKFIERLVAAVWNKGSCAFVEIIGRKSTAVQYSAPYSSKEAGEKEFTQGAFPLFEIVEQIIAIECAQLVRELSEAT